MTAPSSTRGRGFTTIVAGGTVSILVLLGAACSKSAPETVATAKPEAPPAKQAAPVTATPAVVVAKAPPAGPALDSVDQRVSYGVGYNVGSAFARQSDLAADKEAIMAGLEDGLAGTKTRISGEDIQAAFGAMQKRVAEKQLQITQTFFDRNGLRPGVVKTPSGLQYEVLVHGAGKVKPKPTDTVTVNYEGSLLDGTVFDSSIKRGTPATFAVNGVIRGWTEALQLMTVGDKWKIFIPASLAYGQRANGKIPPNSALVFEVELLAIK